LYDNLYAVAVNQYIQECPRNEFTEITIKTFQAIEIIQTHKNSQKAAMALQKLGVTSEFIEKIEINHNTFTVQALKEVLVALKELRHEIARQPNFKGIASIATLAASLDKVIVSIEKRILLLNPKKSKNKELSEEELQLNLKAAIKPCNDLNEPRTGIAEIINNFKVESKAIAEKLREMRFEANKKEKKALTEYVEKADKYYADLLKTTAKRIREKDLALKKVYEHRQQQKKYNLATI
jgi:hypothetical protein